MKQRSNGLPNAGILGSDQLFGQLQDSFVGCHREKVEKNVKSLNTVNRVGCI
jgi:hypothetical protein